MLHTQARTSATHTHTDLQVLIKLVLVKIRIRYCSNIAYSLLTSYRVLAGFSLIT